MSGTRRHFSAEQKAQVVRRHLAGKEPVSKLAEELQIQPSLIHLGGELTSLRSFAPHTLG